MEMNQTVTILGVPIKPLIFEKSVDLVEGIILNRKPVLIAFANTNLLNLAYENVFYRNVLSGAAMVLRDGTGAQWAIRKRGYDPKHNFVGTDFIPEFCKSTDFRGYRIYLLGAKHGVADAAARALQRIAPGVIVTGSHHGYFNLSESQTVVQQINASNSDILLVAMGNPKQEIWISQHLDHLNVPVCFGVGALFDYLAGRSIRAPRLLLHLGMEWVFRLATEPMRLWKRYLLGNPLFIHRVLRELSTEM